MLGCRDDSSIERPAGSGLLSLPDNSTARAVPGGTIKSFVQNDASSFDPLASGSFATHSQVAAYTYPRLLKFQAAIYPFAATDAVEGDLAESFELSGDRLQLTLRLRQGLKWEQRGPTNGRQIDASDVVFSWNKFARMAPSRAELIYHPETAPGSPVEAISSPDPRTVVFKLKHADAALLSLLAFDRLFYVMPRESERDFDPRVEVRGYGPWLMAENSSGFRRVWTKNPDYYVKGRPFADRIEQLVVFDYNSRLAQFKAGLIWTSVATQDDILPAKREVPELLLRQGDAFAGTGGSLAFGYDGDSPWRDERLRQAVSHLIDRETMVDLKSDRQRFLDEGLPVQTRYHSAISAAWEGYWVDPLDNVRFNSASRFFEFDPAEARRLMAAAGHPDGFDTLFHFNGGNEYGLAYARTAELVSGMLHQGGVRARLDPRADFQGDWLPNYAFGYTTASAAGKQVRGFPGIVYRTLPNYPTFATQAFSTLHRGGSRFLGMTPDGKNAAQGDPDMNHLTEQIRREFDPTKQREQALELARLVARRAYDLPMLPYATLPFTLTWPAIGNFGLYRGWPGGTPVTETSIHHWVDASKPPLGSS